MKDHDPIARSVIGDAFADGGYDSGSFVSEDARCRMRSGGNLLEVGAADAAGVDADEHFARADRGHRNCFEADVVDAAVDRSVHCCWNGL